MRTVLLLLASIVATPLLLAADVKIVRTWPGYRTAESFQRVSEYFTGRENTGGQTYLRSQPDQRQGFYFLTRVKNGGAPIENATLALHVITQRAPTPVTYTYKVTLPKGDHVFQVGLTGKDWSDAAEHPVAWQLVLTGPGGEPLVEDQSYLWSKPDNK